MCYEIIWVRKDVNVVGFEVRQGTILNFVIIWVKPFMNCHCCRDIIYKKASILNIGDAGEGRWFTTCSDVELSDHSLSCYIGGNTGRT